MDIKTPDCRRKPVARQITCTLFCILLSLPGAAPVSAGTIEDTRHFLQRSGFAEPPDTVFDASRLDRVELVDQVLDNTAAAISTPSPDWTTESLRERVNYKGVTEQKRKQEQRAVWQLERKRLQQLQHWWLVNLTNTDNPLHVKMILFWQNHFTSSHRKVKHAQLMYQQHQLLERHAMGNFGEMLGDIIKDPAMLLYLDNNANKKSAPNENLARELLELFTLGEGHYTENDIKEAARALTGNGVNRSMEYTFHSKRHDAGQKTILGVTQDHTVDTLVDTILDDPQTAIFITEKLWMHFISPTPDPVMLIGLATMFRDGGYEIKPLLRAMFLSDAFWAIENRGQLIKSPAAYITGTLRALQMPSINQASAVRAMKGMEQELFNPPNVRGWPGGKYWITGNTLLTRTTFVNAVLRDPDRLFAVATMKNNRNEDGFKQSSMSMNTMIIDQDQTNTVQVQSSLAGDSWLHSDLSIEDITASLLIDGIERQDKNVASRKAAINQLFLEPAWHLY